MEAQSKRSTALARWITGRQNYYLKVRGAPPSDGLSIISVKAIERLGSPYHITIELTAKVELARADYLGHNATFSIEPLPGDGTPREWNGNITRFTRTRKTRDFCAYLLPGFLALRRSMLPRAIPTTRSGGAWRRKSEARQAQPS